MFVKGQLKSGRGHEKDKRAGEGNRGIKKIIPHNQVELRRWLEHISLWLTLAFTLIFCQFQVMETFKC